MMAAAVIQMTGFATREAKKKETHLKAEISEMVEAVKFAEAHNLEMVLEKLRPGQGVPFYWRFVRIV